MASATKYVAGAAQRSASTRSSMPPCAPSRLPRVLDAGVALEVRLEQVARGRRERHGEPELERVQRRERVAVRLVVEGEEHDRDARHQPGQQPLDGLLRRDLLGQLAPAEQPPAGVGGDVGAPHPEEHRQQQLAAPARRRRGCRGWPPGTRTRARSRRRRASSPTAARRRSGAPRPRPRARTRPRASAPAARSPRRSRPGAPPRPRPAAPARPTGVSGRRLRVMAENSCDAITAATAAGTATTQPPRSAAYSASAASGTASTTRRDELAHRRAEPSLAAGVGVQRGLELGAAEVGPERGRELELRVGRLPQQEVRHAHLAARADDQVGVGHVGRVQVLAQPLLVDGGGVDAGGR